IGKLRDGDRIEVVIDRRQLGGHVNLIGTAEGPLDHAQADALLASRAPFPGLAAAAALPADTRLWALLQKISGGTWGGCVYDLEKIREVIEAGLAMPRS